MSSTRVVARAGVVAELVGARTRCTTLRSSPPLTFRDTPGALHLVGTAAGPIGGDDLHLDVHVGAGATLELRSVAAAVALPGPVPAPSHQRTTLSLAPGASLRWLLEPTILVAGCDHRATTTVDVAAGASLVWREEVVLGRHEAVSGSLLQRLRVDREGRPLLRNDLAVGPAWPGADGPAGAGPARAVGTVLAVGTPAAGLACGDDRTGGLVVGEGPVRLATAWLAEDVVVVTAVAAGAAALRTALAAVLAGVAPAAMRPA